MRLLLLLFLALSCVESPFPHVVQYRVGEFHPRLGDGPEPSLVLELVNPLPYPITAFVRCYSGAHKLSWVEDVPARTSKRGFATVLNWDIITEVCTVEHWEKR